MPPKVKITKEAIVEAALGLVRKAGPAGLNARALAEAMGCSTQPIFSSFPGMENLMQAVLEAAYQFYFDYRERDMAEGRYPPYKASGMSYIRFAKEEPQLFRLIFLRKRPEAEQTGEAGKDERILALVEKNTGLSRPLVELLHLELWALVHGIAVLTATGNQDISEEMISEMLTDVYIGAQKMQKEKEMQHGKYD